MAITVFTDRPQMLLRAIYKAIDEERIRTWSYDPEGDFTHTADQWRNEAWLRPRVLDDRIRFIIVPPNKRRITTAVYAIYHGRFAEMLLARFDEHYTDIRLTAMPSHGDDV
jgi:hypothetical protein